MTDKIPDAGEGGEQAGGRPAVTWALAHTIKRANARTLAARRGQARKACLPNLDG